MKISAAQGTATIKLMNQALRVFTGQKLTLYLSTRSLAQSTSNQLYLAAVAPGSQITIGRVTLNVAMLKKAVSR